MILGFIKRYVTELNKPVFIGCTIFTAFLIWVNYYYRIDLFISNTYSSTSYFFLRYLVFLAAFTLPWYFYYLSNTKNYFKNPLFLFLVFISPAIFSLKMSMSTSIRFCEDLLCNDYWNQVVYWPARLLVMMIILFILWKAFYGNESFFGLTTKNLACRQAGFKWKPYLLLLLIMIPLIAAASTQKDFLSVYPKMQTVSGFLEKSSNSWLYKLLFELSYGSDFISIELFFRGFLILGFMKLAGKEAILPMACFYCTIHFGKPSGECISSYFGGILLGIVVYNTRTIYGGLVVHLGIAWLMELGGYIGKL